MTDQGGRGNSANWPRNFGRRGASPDEGLVAVTRGLRLFNKNTGGSKPERVCTAAETCPVPVPESPVQGEEGPVNGGGNYDPLKVA